jgi:hypothetical protein
MPLPTTFPAPILETVLARLAALFLTGAGDDPIAARQAAIEMLTAYDPQTPDELRVAANIVTFSFQALEALSQAATPDMPLNRILRLRGGAVTLNREAAKAERRLAELKKARQQLIQAQQPEPVQPAPKIERAAALIQQTAQIAQVAKTNNMTWAQAEQQRQNDLRILASMQGADAKIAAMVNASLQGLPNNHSRIATARTT